MEHVSSPEEEVLGRHMEEKLVGYNTVSCVSEVKCS